MSDLKNAVMLEQDIHTKDKNCVKLQNYSLVDQRG